MLSLKTELLPFLERTEAMLGAGELGRLTIVDAEAATIPLLGALAARSQRWFITVLKGGAARAATRSAPGAWQPYRQRDQVRPLTVTFQGKTAPEGGLTLRGVEMLRVGSRRPHPTLFVTDAPPERLDDAAVADAYLSRWPHQEGVFRNGRSGAGLERSHGYGGTTVAHVALETDQEKAVARVKRARRKVDSEATRAAQFHQTWQAAPRGRRTAAFREHQRAQRMLKQAQRALAKAEAQQQRLARPAAGDLPAGSDPRQPDDVPETDGADAAGVRAQGVLRRPGPRCSGERMKYLTKRFAQFR